MRNFIAGIFSAVLLCSTTASASIKVVTYNIHWGTSEPPPISDGAHNLDRIVHLIALQNADVVVLQEVHRYSYYSYCENQPDLIRSKLAAPPWNINYPEANTFYFNEYGERLGYQCGGFPMTENGTLILSKHPLSNKVPTALFSPDPNAPGWLVSATVSHPEGVFDIHSVHLNGLDPFLLAQANDVRVAIDKRTPGILLGDFNNSVNSWALDPLGMVSAGFAMGGIDHIFFKRNAGLRPTFGAEQWSVESNPPACCAPGTNCLTCRASDHPLLWATVHFKGYERGWESRHGLCLPMGQWPVSHLPGYWNEPE